MAPTYRSLDPICLRLIKGRIFHRAPLKDFGHDGETGLWPQPSLRVVAFAQSPDDLTLHRLRLIKGGIFHRAPLKDFGRM